MAASLCLSLPDSLSVTPGGRLPPVPACLAERRMTWEHYGCGISEELIVNVTNAMVQHGYKDAGYEYASPLLARAALAASLSSNTHRALPIQVRSTRLTLAGGTSIVAPQVCQHRRLLAGTAARRNNWSNHGGQCHVSARNQVARGLRPLEGPQVWHLCASPPRLYVAVSLRAAMRRHAADVAPCTTL
jgi:hypothetical protein